ncbi:hypothetical protein GCM10011521_19950 [Arenimonas soli]|uniref:ABC transporter permease n=1 Tax=Arenimonas soli TaxID=2269504 RepID=A0ABQ1HKZ3_9GAMM|nr:hypothetical protein [Arenimonas soli]GGA81606.1 hypothetical protein GCM10011521_19950 [Arenimonas soli]
MPLGEMVGEVLVQIVFEFLIKGPGFVIARLFNPRLDIESAWTVVAGLLFWGALGGLGYLAYQSTVS